MHNYINGIMSICTDEIQSHRTTYWSHKLGLYFSSRALYCDLKIVIWWEEKHKFERRKFPTKKNILQKFEFDLLRLFGLLKKNFGFQKDFFFLNDFRFSKRFWVF